MNEAGRRDGWHSPSTELYSFADVVSLTSHHLLGSADFHRRGRKSHWWWGWRLCLLLCSPSARNGVYEQAQSASCLSS